MSDTQHVGPLSAEQLAELRLVVDEERTSYDGTPFAKLGFWPSKVDALLNALAAAEARATAAAAEAGKWQQRHGELQQELAEQEVQALALIEVLATASAKEFLDNAEIKEMVEDPRVAGRWTLFRRGMEHGANELARKALGMKEAPAPVAPQQQQQEGGGQ